MLHIEDAVEYSSSQYLDMKLLLGSLSYKQTGDGTSRSQWLLCIGMYSWDRALCYPYHIFEVVNSGLQVLGMRKWTYARWQLLRKSMYIRSSSAPHALSKSRYVQRGDLLYLVHTSMIWPPKRNLYICRNISSGKSRRCMFSRMLLHGTHNLRWSRECALEGSCIKSKFWVNRGRLLLISVLDVYAVKEIRELLRIKTRWRKQRKEYLI